MLLRSIPNSGRVQKPYAVSDQNAYDQNQYSISDENVLKTIAFEAGHIYIADIKECLLASYISKCVDGK